MTKKYYGGIGSRDTSPEIMEIMTEIAQKLEQHGYILRSGGADGADTAFENGVSNPDMKNIFIPYNGFNDHRDGVDGSIYISDTHPEYSVAHQSLVYHPKGFKLNLSSRQMMVRNYFQVMGRASEPQSKFIICYTENGKLKGGTAQAMRIALDKGIPIYNLGDFVYQTYTADEIVNLAIQEDNLLDTEEELPLF